MADITAFDTVVKGVNSPNNYTRSEAHLIDGAEFPAILAQGEHPAFYLPKGAAVTGVKIISLADAGSSGNAVLMFKYTDGVCDTELSNCTKAQLEKGFVTHHTVEHEKAYDFNAVPLIKVCVGTADFTALKVLVIVEYIPVEEFMTAG